jgi:hypothetical protein
MAGWYRKDLADDARVLMLLGLGQAEVVKAHLRITEHRVRNEEDEPPIGMEQWKEKLQDLDLWRNLEDLIGVQMAQRARTNKSRKRNAMTRDVTLHDVTKRDVTATQHNTTQDNKEKKKRAPRVPKPSEDGWAPKQDHIDIAKERGLDLNTEVTAMLDWLKASGKTYKDYDAFARNWLRRANPRPAQVKRPNLSNNLLQTNDHPEGAGEEYWLAGINKYGGNHG